MIQEIEKELTSYTKKDFMDLLQQLLDDNLFEEKDLIQYINPAKQSLSKDEEEIIQQLKDKTTLTTEQTMYIIDTLKKANNRKITSVLKGKNLFLASIVEFKIENHFENIWKIYPRKIGKDIGKKAFYKLIQDATVSNIDFVCNFVLSRVKYYANICKDRATEEQFILHFSTFCNSKKYL